MTTTIAGVLARLRLIHPAPAAAVVALSAALAAILAVQADREPWDVRVLLTAVAVAGSQVLVGSVNDWADRSRDARHQPRKPIPSGSASPRDALVLAAGGAALQLGASAVLGPVALALGAAASLSGLAYDLWLSRTPASVLPYLVSFGLLPVWIAAGVGVPIERVAAAALLALPFAAAAHLANALRDYDGDATAGSRNLAQTLGRRTAHRAALGLAIGTGIGVAAAFLAADRLSPASVALGAVGIGAVAAGVGSVQRLWLGVLVAAVCWTAAWALASA